MRNRRLLGLVAFALALGSRSAPAVADGFEWSPAIRFTQGDHRLSLDLDSRLRWELWEAFTENDDNFYAARTRLGLGYDWRDRLRVYGQGQLTNIWDLDDSASGAAAVYRANATNPNASSVSSIRVRQLFAEARLDPDNWVRVGRQDINVGTLIHYDEPDWKWLKAKRLSQRLVGTVGWTHGERSYDGVALRVTPEEGHVLHLFGAEPTTGVFEIDSAYKRQRHVIFGGAEWTVERGTWLPDTELEAFFITYFDDRDPSKVGAPLFGEIELYTFGFSMLGIHPLGRGKLDLLLWGALQLGEYDDMTPRGVRELDQLAGAVLAEVGYQLPETWARPWLRTGVNFASGDGSPNDGDRNTFFNLLPTNHPYYGYADQLAFANLIDLFVQLTLAPTAKLGFEVAFHQFWLHEDRDFRYAGTGAYSRTNFGYGRSDPGGANDVGQEIDVVVSYVLRKGVGLMAGYSRLFGGHVFDSSADDDVDWAFVQLALHY